MYFVAKKNRFKWVEKGFNVGSRSGEKKKELKIATFGHTATSTSIV